VNYGKSKQAINMDKKQRKEIEQKFINAAEVQHVPEVRRYLKAMTDEELSDHYADFVQLAMVYRDNPQIRHLPPYEVMQLPLQEIEVWQKIDGKAELKSRKFVLAA